MPLTPKQQTFLKFYLGEANFNATEAARLAGYSGEDSVLRASASRLLHSPKVAAAFRAAWEERGMEPAEIIGRLADIARGSLAEFVDVEGYGFSLNMTKAQEAGKLHLLKKLKHGKFGVEIELHSPLEALDKLARVHKLFADQMINVDVEFIQIVLNSLPDEYREGVRAALEGAGGEADR